MTNQENNIGNISPDGKWKMVIQGNQVRWIELTESKNQYTIKELVEATKNMAPEIWKNQ
jgi:hypothetical protein|tara:strand:+ start:222 stop:398 length:177 start_codon:yes stop_codon:yes gene_type:complete